MNKEAWGIKRVCLQCGTRFYDLNKSPILCPNCGEEFDPDYMTKKKSKLEEDKEVVEAIDEVDLIEDDEDIDSNSDVNIDQDEAED
jgi:uncharacterized protein (TIGR02300 family)